jgi:predicted permease
VTDAAGPKPRPPAIVRLALFVLLPADEREFYLGDLQESGRRQWLREIAGAAAMRFTPRPPHSGTRSGRTSSMFQHLGSDLRLGFRRLSRTPASTLTALTALAIGIGMSALMVSLISGGLLPTLPFENGERIVRVERIEYARISADAFVQWRERQRSFEGLGASIDRPVNLTVDGESDAPVMIAAMDAKALPLLSVRPMVGRLFTEADATPGAPAVVLLGHRIWQTRLNADPAAVGRTVRVNGEAAVVIGVMPEGFGFPFMHEMWRPLALEALRGSAGSERLTVFGVLREGVTTEAAAAELNALDRQRPRPATESEAPLVQVVNYTDIINPHGQSQILAAVMLAVALLVLMVACANAANVLLAQAVVRGREVAVRSALGASRARIATQFWVEVSLLALAGAAGGVLLAGLGIRLIRNAVPAASGMPFWFDLRLSPAVIAFVAVAAVVAAMVAGVAPVMHAARSNRAVLLRDATRGTSSRRLG